MKIIKGGKSGNANDDFESDKEYAQILKSGIDKYFGKKLFDKELEFIYDVARFCWNFSIITPISDNHLFKDFKVILKEFGLEKNEIKSFVGFTQDLANVPQKYNRLIKDFDIEEFGEGNYHVIVKTISQEDFIKQAERDDAADPGYEEFVEIEFAPNFVSRSLLTLKPTPAFIDQFKGKQKQGSSPLSSPHAILIELTYEDIAFEDAFEGFKQDIFEYLFFMLGIKQKDQPKKLDLLLFKTWFDFELFPDVFDTGFEPVRKA